MSTLIDGFINELVVFLYQWSSLVLLQMYRYGFCSIWICLCRTPGHHGWTNQSCFIRPEKTPVNWLQLNVFIVMVIGDIGIFPWSSLTYTDRLGTNRTMSMLCRRSGLLSRQLDCLQYSIFSSIHLEDSEWALSGKNRQPCWGILPTKISMYPQYRTGLHRLESCYWV